MQGSDSNSVAGATVPEHGESAVARKRLDGGESGEEAARDYGGGSSEYHTRHAGDTDW